MELNKEKLKSFLNMSRKNFEHTAFQYLEKMKKENTVQNNELLHSKIKNELENEQKLMEPMVAVLAENISQDMSAVYKTAFKKPLKEEWPKTKFIMDCIAQKTRYFIFVIGLFSILIVIITILIT